MDGDLRLELSDSEDVDSNWESSSNDEETDEEEIDISDEEESDDGEDAIVEVAPEPGAKAGTSETSATIQTERNNNKSKTKLQTPDGVDLFLRGGS